MHILDDPKKFDESVGPLIQRRVLRSGLGERITIEMVILHCSSFFNPDGCPVFYSMVKNGSLLCLEDRRSFHLEGVETFQRALCKVSWHKYFHEDLHLACEIPEVDGIAMKIDCIRKLTSTEWERIRHDGRVDFIM